MDWSWVASCRNRGQPGLRFPKRKTRRPRLIWLRRRLDEKPTSERSSAWALLYQIAAQGLASQNRHFHFSHNKKKRYLVLVHIFNQIAFRWVPQRRAVGKNTTVFTSRAMRYMSCFEPGLAHVYEPNERCGTTHQRHSRSPRRGSRGESSHD